MPETFNCSIARDTPVYTRFLLPLKRLRCTCTFGACDPCVEYTVWHAQELGPLVAQRGHHARRLRRQPGRASRPPPAQQLHVAQHLLLTRRVLFPERRVLEPPGARQAQPIVVPRVLVVSTVA